jgi:hypothetical protein
MESSYDRMKKAKRKQIIEDSKAKSLGGANAY